MLPNVNVRKAKPADREELKQFIVEFRIHMASFRDVKRKMDLDTAGQELDSYQKPRHHVYVADLGGGRIGGYLICRIDDNVVWAESIYVPSELRRHGIGSALYLQVEGLARNFGQSTVYNWIHPNNDAIISFLWNRGYNVLNLIEVRKRLPGEHSVSRIQVGNMEYEY